MQQIKLIEISPLTNSPKKGMVNKYEVFEIRISTCFDCSETHHVRSTIKA